MSKFNELVAKLSEIFQIDKPDLDFGIYRILNARRAEIDDYLSTRLKAKVETSLAQGAMAQQDSDKQQLIASIKEEFGKRAFNEAGVLVDETAIASELGQKLMALQTKGANPEDQQNQVFSHLLTFFSRYYDNGDFISQRRYKGDTYAIPYSGEEVMLHWANKDQYYIKSGENFSNYTIALDDGRKVQFRLVSADTAKDNRKDNDQERRFVLIDPHTRTEIDEETGEEYETQLVPLEVIGNELIIRFAYKPMPKGTKQDKLNEAAFARLKSDPMLLASWSALLERAPTEKNPARTKLEKYLTDYTGKNSADYFIHKNLGKFLRGELDFYIKNEVMHLDDLQDARAFSDIESKLRLIQTLRTIALDLIDFMAQLEDFQKKLWLKKKFVTETQYCITLDRVPEALYSDIIANEQQHNEWVKLFAIDEIKGDMATVGYSNPLTVEFLKANPFLVLDTAFFDEAFKAELLNSIENLDEQCDGLLIHSENFQALNLLQERYLESITAIYNDPPYNAKSSEIIYKNSYKHSSWMSLMSDRISLALRLKASEGALITAIDENEQSNLIQILKNKYPNMENVCLSIVHNPAGVQGDNFSYSHEYAIYTYENRKNLIGKTERDEVSEEAFRDWGGTSSRSLAKNCFYPIVVRDGEIIRFENVCDDNFHPNASNIKIGDETWVYPIADDGEERKWVFARNSVEKIRQELKVKERNGVISISRSKTITSYKTVWSGNKFYANIYGSKLLNNIMGNSIFDFPKSIYTVQECLYALQIFRNRHSTALDYFAGSGTTGHAVINLNREDNGKRKYILVEMGAHFDTVTKPRIQKVIYSKDWKDGKPVSREGISQCFKYLRLESYEDTLNNLNLVRSQAHNDLFAQAPEVKEDYLLHYMLDIESKGSLLSVEAFQQPFDYSLNIAVDSAGAYQSKKIDLVETFNYLIGLRVKHIDNQRKQGFVTVTGTLPTGETCLVIWRDTEQLDYDGISRLCDRLAINPADNEYDVVYINGDHNIPTVLTQTNDEGGATRVLKLRQIEHEFLARMFTVEDV
jgi:adenine-specific DNA-methyltransferase